TENVRSDRKRLGKRVRVVDRAAQANALRDVGGGFCGLAAPEPQLGQRGGDSRNEVHVPCNASPLARACQKRDCALLVSLELEEPAQVGVGQGDSANVAVLRRELERLLEYLPPAVRLTKALEPRAEMRQRRDDPARLAA